MTDEREWATAEEVERGLRFGHLMVSMNRHVGQEGAAYAQAILGLLLDKGIITPEEFEERVEAHRKEMSGNPQVMLNKMPDKYSAEGKVILDCASRVELCKAACCTFRFYLTPQDLDERIVKWDYGNPYWVRCRADGYCMHCDPDSLTCEVHEQRPYTCRSYDCRQDKRVWVDFEKRIPSPDLLKGKPTSIPPPAALAGLPAARGRAEPAAAGAPEEDSSGVGEQPQSSQPAMGDSDQTGPEAGTAEEV